MSKVQFTPKTTNPLKQLLQEKLTSKAKTFMDYVEWFDRLTNKQADKNKHHLVISVKEAKEASEAATREWLTEKRLPYPSSYNAWIDELIRELSIVSSEMNKGAK